MTDAGDSASAGDVPTSFGVFKPVGYVMMGLPTQSQSDALVLALHGAGWQGSSVLNFTPRETAAELQALLDNASAMAGQKLYGRRAAVAKPGEVRSQPQASNRLLNPSSGRSIPHWHQCQVQRLPRVARADRRAWQAATPPHA